MHYRLSAKTIYITFTNTKTVPSLEVLTKRILMHHPLETHIESLFIGTNSNTINVLIVFKKKRNITNKNYFNFIFNSTYESSSTRNINKHILTIISMPNKLVKGNISKIRLPELEVILVEQQIQKSLNITDFINIDNQGTQYKTLLYHSGHKVARFAKYYQLNAYLSHLREKNNIYFDISGIRQDGLKYMSKCALRQLIQILEFLNQHNEPPKRHYKSKMLHLWSSEPGLGKTSLVNFLKTVSPCYLWPDDTWFDHYENYLYQWIIWDEFKLTGQSTEFLKRFFAGSEMRLPVKGAHTLKKDNPLVILTSNYSLEEHIQRKISTIQQQKIELMSFQARIKEIQLTSAIFEKEGFDDWYNLMVNNLKYIKK
jgi:hypothetical protein